MRTKHEYTECLMFVELSAISNFSFLKGATHPEEYMERAALLGLSGLAVADENSVAGVVRAHSEARKIKRLVAERQAADVYGPPRPKNIAKPLSANILNTPRLIPAATLVFEECLTLTALPENRTGWANLCRILSKGRLRAKKGVCHLRLSDLLERSEGLQLVLHPPYEILLQRGTPKSWPHADPVTRRLRAHMPLIPTPCPAGRVG